MVSSLRGTEQLQQQKHTTASIVVGADVRGRSTSAVVWAAEEAQRTGHPLLVVTAHDRPPSDHDEGQHGMASLARQLTLSDVAFHEEVGSAVDALLASARRTPSCLVVGRRSSGTAPRMPIGSTSRSVVGRAEVPVVVVPEPWIQPTMSTAPIVVGYRVAGAEERRHRRTHRDDEVLAFAFERAQQMRVPLIVVSAWEMPTIYTWSPADVARWRHRYASSLDERLAPWRAQYAGLEVVARSLPEPAHLAVLDASKVGQLTVVGRHSSPHVGGFPMGSTARQCTQRCRATCRGHPGTVRGTDTLRTRADEKRLRR